MQLLPLLALLCMGSSGALGQEPSRRILGGLAAYRDMQPWTMSIKTSQHRVHYCNGVLVTTNLVLTVLYCAPLDLSETVILSGGAKLTVGLDFDLYIGVEYYFEQTSSAHLLRMTYEERAELNATLIMIRINRAFEAMDPVCFRFVTLLRRPLNDQDSLDFSAFGGDGFRETSPCLRTLRGIRPLKMELCLKDDRHYCRATEDEVRCTNKDETHLAEYPILHNKSFAFICVKYRHKDSEFAFAQHKVACRSDIGGPLTLDGKLAGIVTGINSEKCGHPGYDVFVDVFTHSSWIEQQILHAMERLNFQQNYFG